MTSPSSSTSAPVSATASDTAEEQTASGLPRQERLRIELKRRILTVTASERITPHMLRVTLTGEDLHDFQSPGFDDNVKLFFEMADGETVGRSYTPRSFDIERRELVLDFALHEAGPATKWALEAGIGDTLVVGGPRGSRVIHGEIRNWLLIGDETALPAMGRRIEEGQPHERFTMIAGVPGTADEQSFDTPCELTCQWLYRTEEQAADPEPFLNAVKALDIPEGTFIWIAAEARVAQALKSYVLDDLKIDPVWIKSSGYWTNGLPGK